MQNEKEQGYRRPAYWLQARRRGLKSEDHGFIAVNEYLVRDNPA